VRGATVYNQVKSTHPLKERNTMQVAEKAKKKRGGGYFKAGGNRGKGDEKGETAKN